MKNVAFVVAAICVGSATTVVVGQSNYVITSPNSSTPGAFNTVIGVKAGADPAFVGNANTFLGYQTGASNQTGADNVFIGVNAGARNIDGSFNLFVGGNAGQANTTGRENLFFGSGSGYSNTIGRFNTFVGINSGFSNTNGENNVFFGQRAGYSNTAGNFNMFLGASTGYSNTIGVYNTFVGNGAGYSNTSGNNNTMVGLNSGFKTTGSDNLMIGSSAGYENTTGTQNTFIGNGAGVSAGNPSLQNATAIGFGAQVSASNSFVLGANANVGIGTTAPKNKLEITQGTNGNSGLRLTNLPIGTAVSRASSDKFLTVNENGDVVLRRVDLSLLSVAVGIGGRLGAGPWTMEGDAISSGKSPVVIGDSALNVPDGYKLYVADGILTERVKVAVKNSDEWADYVFAKDYKLRSLDEVKRFIQTNKHLPGVPSADDIAKEGIDVGKMHAKLLEKIEELTLYMIELKQENRVLKNTVEKLVKKTGK